MKRSFPPAPPSPSPPLLARAPCQMLSASTVLQGQWAGQQSVVLALVTFTWVVPFPFVCSMCQPLSSCMHAHWIAWLSLEDRNSRPIQLTTLTCSIKSLISCAHHSPQLLAKWYRSKCWRVKSNLKMESSHSLVVKLWQKGVGIQLLLWSHEVMSDSVAPWTVACQALLSIGFPRQEDWSGLSFPSQGLSSWPRDWRCVFCIALNMGIPYSLLALF